ncbi:MULTISPECIES: TetR/AcrR family transcriptional regulator [unclassified Nocardioides]|uniref:TetR/AcrR family transcriptional regulator n=1 Tax=unclassified Nocardioides TaxID=2615069 RepID=UPI0006F6D5B9|nr:MULTISPECIES: TetR/AcrR family transcriptional regulator [unclassified Nocardioides]KQY57206.1 TetR family transcriptional regulator [Nocardioides sp. Root140]KQZ68721.1 TetR family transcriptional regulator [Nocardioides sp. Root151]KRF11849.1 TetR family transcriptional regulator [Nocardioides sp. Soil796]
MTETVGKKRGTPRTRDEKYDERRTQLAESALTTLGELGYARTSLREIAQHSEFSHGVVHYYFNSKADLIIHCVRYYKTKCSKRYDDVVATATTGDELVAGFIDKLVETLRDEAPMHRLWYDLRGQSMFEEEFREQVKVIDGLLEDMIWRIVTRYSELTGAEPAFTPATTYAMVDGVFVRALLAHVHGEEDALETLRAQTLSILPALFRS